MPRLASRAWRAAALPGVPLRDFRVGLQPWACQWTRPNATGSERFSTVAVGNVVDWTLHGQRGLCSWASSRIACESGISLVPGEVATADTKGPLLC